ncbi:NAD(P)/FAD-dependent oxidoreductase [Thermofilum pendens]|uniref:FAD dependent oxidoreductase n=1 Tax=Thermofilum pendens (strain DSM 2475 / Hrk 5) TaxID=368408 RepID=A1RWE4_THEPD|nr:NAD(P)/FAD-dependent oxidoreductase [Thermofilum pendens]ABL77524.1 FAD dependent oxidoreductase [Thermofilum pendens Hrk 5]
MGLIEGRYEAVVIGLGPAGAAALKRLQELGIKAVGIERKKAPEEPAVCGEFLPEPSAIEFISRFPSVRKAYEYIGLARRTNAIRRIILSFAGGKTYNLEIPGFTVSRKEMVSKLIEGSDYVTGSDVVGIRRVGDAYLVKTRRGKEFSASYVIAADGFPSATRRLLGLPAGLQPEDYAVGVNLKMETPSMPRDTIFMYASSFTQGGYAWIIPVGDGLSNVGIGLRFNYVKKGANPLKALTSFVELERRGFLDSSRQLEEPRSRMIPVSGFYSEPSTGKVLFAGDSLGAVNPINGGGIFTAMALGILAAESVWLGNPGIYDERSWREIGQVLSIGRAYRVLVDFLYEHFDHVAVLTALFPRFLLEKILKGEKTPIKGILEIGIGRKTSYRPPRGQASRKPP